MGTRTDAEVGIETDAEVFSETDSDEDRRQSISLQAERTDVMFLLYSVNIKSHLTANLSKVTH